MDTLDQETVHWSLLCLSGELYYYNESHSISQHVAQRQIYFNTILVPTLASARLPFAQSSIHKTRQYG